MGFREVIAVIILFIFIFSPLAAVASGQPSFLEMRRYYVDKMGKPDHVVVEYCLTHPTKWVKKTLVWEQRAFVTFLWRPKFGWVILNIQAMPGALDAKKEPLQEKIQKGDGKTSI
jgi:hypothetical protein